MEGSPGDIHPISRDPLRFDLPQMFAAHIDARDGTLQDPEARGEFVSSLGEPLKRAIADPTLLRGLRTEAMFESLVVSLGQIELMKKEDTGPAWTRRRGLRIPDYRIVLPDDTGFLVEVKHFHQRGEPNKAFPYLPQLPGRPTSLRAARQMSSEAGRVLVAVEPLDAGPTVRVRARWTSVIVDGTRLQGERDGDLG